MTTPDSPRPTPDAAGSTGSGLYAASLTAVFTVYRRVLSPVFSSSGLGQCRYLPTCSEYAHIALARHGLARGSALAAARLLRCHPWTAGGLDPVPTGPHPIRDAGATHADAAATAAIHDPQP